MHTRKVIFKGRLSDQPLPHPLIKDLLVYVAWEDAVGCTQEWTPMEELEGGKTSECYSVGALITNEEKHIVLVPPFGTGPYMGLGELAIPKSQIREIYYLQPAQEAKL